MSWRLLFLIAAMATLSASAQEAITPDRKLQLFNGKDLDGWYTWLKDNHYSDPRKVFTVTPKHEIRISGEEWGGIATRNAYRDYHLVVEWRWGNKTWGAREKRARDSGILVHAVGEDGAAGGTWLESIESQIIEGGSGDLLLVAGKSRPSATATVTVEGQETYWNSSGDAVTRDKGRINWWGRSRSWKDELGYRGPRDVEKPAGSWNRQEIFADGSKLTYVLNGKVVNQAYDLSVTAGKIQLQSEGAEIFVRKVTIEPLTGLRPAKQPWRARD